ncbi:MAG: M16 family metallopeptidase, partial [Balneolaceae bacterium]
MKKIIITLSILLIAGIQLADAQKKWDEIEFPEINNFERPDVEVFELDNGITFYLVEDDELPLINVSVRVRTGAVLESDDKVGLASMAGTVMRSGGSEKYPADQLNELLENKAARMETGIGFTSGTASMNVLKEDFDELLPVFIDLLQNPLFPEDKIELAKTQTKSGISRRNDDQGSIANREFERIIYGQDSVYGRLTEYETVDNITREDLVAFHEETFKGNNLMVGVIGDFNMRDMKRKLRNAFGSIPAGEGINLLFPEVDYEFKQTVNFINKSDVNQSYVLLGHIGGMRDNPDYAKLQVMNQVLSGGFSGRLFRVVRSDMGLAYAVFGSYRSGNFYPGTFTTGVMTQSETTAEAIEAIIEQIKRLQNEPITEEELQQTKDQFLNSIVFQYDSKAKVLNQRLTNEYAGLPEDSFDKLVEEVRNVTIEDVQRMAQKYLQPGEMQILVVGNKAEIGNQLEKFGEVNEIDITIPEPGGTVDDAIAGDTALGKEWLGKMSEAVLPSLTLDGIVKVESDNIINTPQGEMSLGSVEELNFLKNEFRAEVNAPMGQIVTEIIDGKGKMKMGGQEMPMQPAQLDQTLAQYSRNYVNLALNRDEV